jgi:hypothetical protein
VLALADRSADWVDQALRDLEQAEQSMQAARCQMSIRLTGGVNLVDR